VSIVGTDPQGKGGTFNEDARVQLHNLKTQQAFLGLNYRNQYVQSQTVGANQMSLPQNVADNQLQFKQEDVEQLMFQNSDDLNDAFSSQAERIIRQQEAAVEKPELLRTTFPQHGKAYTFQQSIQVEDWSELKLAIDARRAPTSIGLATRSGVLILFALAVLGLLALCRPRAADNAS